MELRLYHPPPVLLLTPEKPAIDHLKGGCSKKCVKIKEKEKENNFDT